MAGQEDIKKRHINALIVEQEQLIQKFQELMGITALVARRRRLLMQEIQRRVKLEKLKEREGQA